MLANMLNDAVGWDRLDDLGARTIQYNVRDIVVEEKIERNRYWFDFLEKWGSEEMGRVLDCYVEKITNMIED